jgi:hypothetical protein
MEKPKYSHALQKWYVKYDKARWFFDSWETANDWYLLNKDKF